ncbi:IS1634 family transposase [Aquibacillus sp. 3ASR75-11]|uniref:IS1634 family transposase n=1 Tax=Terrihalobacillus insolitus TaxID=2950438 RepID=A0A9X3WZY4_9BACI|nr:IS1634 family transposase [Terrihalobacillus insolitus]MDC3426379.1 IS1634 family transposase [Terrihalobacillus insolitus]
MFLKKVTIRRSEKVYNYYKIVTSYRDKDGKPKHRVVQNLGALSDEDANRMRLIIKSQQDSDLVLAKSSDVVVTKHWLYLPVMVLHTLWKKLELHRFFSNSILAEALVLNRCIKPLSKINVVDWMHSTVLPSLYDDDILPDNFAIYRELDHLNAHETDLQTHIYNQLASLDQSIGEAMFYDITSTYMEGSKCVISKFGYSRDHRQDREQVVIALLVTPEGSPFYWKVLDGNTQDITTLPWLIEELKERFSLKTCHMVFDRGMVSKDHLDLLEDKKMTYLSAMDKNEMACHPLFERVMPKAVTPDNYKQRLTLQNFEPIENKRFFIREEKEGKRRYIFSFEVSRFYEDIESRENRIKQAFTWMEAENATLSEAKKSRKAETTVRKVQKMLSKKKLKAFMNVSVIPIELEVLKKDGKTRTVHSFRVCAEVDPEKEKEVRKRDGITCFITNETSLDKEEVVFKYRAKNKIEEAFREMKSQLALRPVYLTRPERVKAHVSVCVLAYLLRNTIELLMQKSNQDMTASNALQKLESCQLNEVGLKDQKGKSITATEMTKEQRQITEWLDATKEIKQTSIKKIVEKLKKSM